MGLETRIFANGTALFSWSGPTGQRGPPLWSSRGGPKYPGRTELKGTFPFDFSLKFLEILP